MGPSKLERHLYKEGTVPKGTSPRHVETVMDRLHSKLSNKMETQYRWLAACPVAVEAGMWGARRRIRQRKKLLALINSCREYLDMPKLEPYEGWYRYNLFFGYGAIQAYSNEYNISTDQIFMLQLLEDAIKGRTGK